MSYELIKLDVLDDVHLKFTYKMLCFRYSKEYINLSNSVLPSYNDHVLFLTKNTYFCFYLMSYKNYIFGEIFIDKDYNIGIYQDKEVLKEIIKNKTEKLHSPFCEPLLDKIVVIHNIKFLKTSININNIPSIMCAKKLNFKEVSRENNYINFERSFL